MKSPKHSSFEPYSLSHLNCSSLKILSCPSCSSCKSCKNFELPTAFVLFLSLLFLVSASLQAAQTPYFEIQVLDDQTNRGVPLVELRTVNGVKFWTDSNGIIAFNEPGMMNQEVYFHIQSDGYTYPEDAFKNRGLKLRPKPGASAQIKIKRLNIAERLYRVTGEGIYRDSILTGRKVPIQQPLLNAQITGQDTVSVTEYKNKLWWFWGDTDRLSYPLGNFSGTGATSDLPNNAGLNPFLGVNLTYFTNNEGFAKQICPDFGRGLQWIEGVFTINDPTGRERLVTRVTSQDGLKPPTQCHFAVWDDDKQHFISLVKWGPKFGHDSAHTFRAKVNGQDYIYLYPNYRVRADWHSVTNLNEYEAFADSTWTKGAARKPQPRGSVSWNNYRKCWIKISSGKPGEIWYSESSSPQGPWPQGVKVVEHNAYNFYNPTQHPYFDQERGRLIYFEGTYTAEFSAAKEKTPRYNYNQIMYRLDLSDRRLKISDTYEPPSTSEQIIPLP